MLAISGLDRGGVPWQFPAGALAAKEAPSSAGELRKGRILQGLGLSGNAGDCRRKVGQHQPTGRWAQHRSVEGIRLFHLSWI